MRVVVQRILQAAVQVNGKEHAAIGPGLLLFVAVKETDTVDDVKAVGEKIKNLRIFADETGKMNKPISAEHSLLLISQFTLYADLKGQNRPYFGAAAKPPQAREFLTLLEEQLRSNGITVKTGVFGEYMQVSLVNDGPVTIILDSLEL